MMRKGKKRSNRITPDEFFAIEGKVFEELWRRYRGGIAAIVLLSLLSAVSRLAEPKFLEYMTNAVSDWLEGNGAFGDIVAVTSLFLFLLLLLRCLKCISDLILVKHESRTAAMAEKKITDKLARISYEYFESSPFYDKMNMARQAGGVYWNAVWGITRMVVLLFLLVAYAVMLYRISAVAVVCLYLTLAICTLVAIKVSGVQTAYWYDHVSPAGRSNNYFRHILDSRVNQQNIQTSGTLPYFSWRYACCNQKELKNCVKLNTLTFGTELASSMLFLVSFFAVLFTVGKGVAEGMYEPGYFTMTAALLLNLFAATKELVNYILNQSWFVRVLDAYYEVLDMAEGEALKDEPQKEMEEERESEGEMLAGIREGCFLEVSGLRYRYPQAEGDALKGVEAQFKKGERIAVVGGNGSGKTTLISVILGLLTAKEGSIRRNGAVCTAILQDFGKYQMTVKENIEIGCGGKELPEEEVFRILKMVDLYDFIMEKPDGIYTKLGQLEEGTELSRGQWQRLATGRLLANREANVWILDEPTAYLDPIAEIEMYDRIFEMAEDRLVFFISHRLGFARKADRILVIQEGKIAESGTHDQLCSTGGNYAKMYAAQKEWYG